LVGGEEGGGRIWILGSVPIHITAFLVASEV
jgi:hypothetical protein